MIYFKFVLFQWFLQQYWSRSIMSKLKEEGEIKKQAEQKYLHINQRESQRTEFDVEIIGEKSKADPQNEQEYCIKIKRRDKKYIITICLMFIYILIISSVVLFQAINKQPVEENKPNSPEAETKIRQIESEAQKGSDMQAKIKQRQAVLKKEEDRLSKKEKDLAEKELRATEVANKQEEIRERQAVLKKEEDRLSKKEKDLAEKELRATEVANKQEEIRERQAVLKKEEDRLSKKEKDLAEKELRATEVANKQEEIKQRQAVLKKEEDRLSKKEKDLAEKEFRIQEQNEFSNSISAGQKKNISFQALYRQEFSQGIYTCSDFSYYIQVIQKRIQNLKNPEGRLICTQYMNRMFDDYDWRLQKLYYIGNYDVFLKQCQQKYFNQYKVRNDQIKQWNQNRDIIQWAILNLQKGDIIYVDSSKALNLLQFIILSQIVSQAGKILVKRLDFNDTCVKTQLELYKIRNIGLITQQKPKFYDYYIGSTEIEIPQQLEKKINNKQKFEGFIYFKNSSILKNFSSHLNIQNYQIENSFCKEPLISNQIKEQGYFFISNVIKQQKNKTNKYKINPPSMIPLQVIQNYIEFKQKLIQKWEMQLSQLKNIQANCGCIDFKQSRNPNSKGFIETVYGNKIFNASNQQLESWEKHREPIQWVRKKVSINSTIIYYLSGRLNIFLITQISLLVKDGKIIVFSDDETYFSQNKKWQRKQFGYSNIQVIKDFQYLIGLTIKQNEYNQTPYVITDSQYLIKKILSLSKIIEEKKVLIYFDEQKANLKFFGSLLGNYELKQIVLRNYSCQGFDYANLFWNSNRIAAFFEVRKSNRYIFVYWDGLPNLMPYQKEHFLYQMSQTAKVQIKILNDKLFLLMESDQIPIHKTYPILSAHHKSDYFRNYLMHFYGGGYADLKHIHFDWNPYFQNMEKNPQLYASGYPERRHFDAGCHQEHGPPNCTVIRKQYKRLLGNTNFIYRRNTTATYEILTWIHKILDKKQSLIYKYPPVSPRQAIGNEVQKDGVKYKSKYPLRWGQLSGQIRSRVCFRDLDRYSLIMPFVLINDYMLK